MERFQMQNVPPRNNNDNKSNNNNPWPRRNPLSDQRPPTPLESTNMIDDLIPFCRPCKSFHEERTCAFARRILEESRNQQDN